MKEKLGRKRKQEKKSYIKPEIRQIELRPEEAVLGFCKTTGSYGPGASNCGVGLYPCSSPGS